MISTRTKTKYEKQQPNKNDLYAMYFMQMEWFEVKTDLTDTKKSLAPPKRWGHSFSICDDRIFLVGGNVGGTSRQPLSIYELIIDNKLQSATWRRFQLTLQDISISAIDSHTCEVIDGDIYVVCGRIDEMTSNRLFRVDISTMTLSEVKLDKPMPKRESHVSFSLEGRFVVMHGGCECKYRDCTTRRLQEDDTLAVVDLRSRKLIDKRDIEQRGVQPSQRESHTRVIHKHGVFVFGGMTVVNDMDEDDESVQSQKREKVMSAARNGRGDRIKNRRKKEQEDDDGTNMSKTDDSGTKQVGMNAYSQNEANHGSMNTELVPDGKIQVDSGMIGKTAVTISESSEEEESNDVLDELFLLKHTINDSGFVFTWQRIEYRGCLPKCSSLVSMNHDDEFLIFFGGEGYYPNKNYSDDRFDILNCVYCLHLETKYAFPLSMVGIQVDPIQSAASFTIRGNHFVFGGQTRQKSYNPRLLMIKLEQRVKRDLFGDFGGSLKSMCQLCKSDLNQSISNMEYQLKLIKKSKNKRADDDKIDSTVLSEQQPFMIPQEIMSDINEMLEMERYQTMFRPPRSQRFLLDKISLMIYVLKQPLFISSINFEALGTSTLAIEIEGSFNIYEQLDRLSTSILNSIFYYLISLANTFKLDAALYVRLTNKVLFFETRGSQTDEVNAAHEYIKCKELQMTDDMPTMVGSGKSAKNVIILSRCRSTFSMIERGGYKDIQLVTQDINGLVEHSVRSYYTLFFKNKTEDLKLSIGGQQLELMHLNNILDRVDTTKTMKVLEENASCRGISFTIKIDESDINPVWKEFIGKRTAIHYGPEYLIQKYFKEGSASDVEQPNQGSVIIIIEKRLRSSV